MKLEPLKTVYMIFQISHEVGAKWIFEIQAAFLGFSRKMVPRNKQ